MVSRPQVNKNTLTFQDIPKTFETLSLNWAKGKPFFRMCMLGYNKISQTCLLEQYEFIDSQSLWLEVQNQGVGSVKPF